MTEITITEALADVKTIDKRIEKKKYFVQSYLVRQERLKDPLEKDGGATKVIHQERQAIQDLQERNPQKLYEKQKKLNSVQNVGLENC
jgi:hypothetical protein